MSFNQMSDNLVQLPNTANPPHLLNLEMGLITFTRIASHMYDLSLSNSIDNSKFVGRIEQKSNCLWAVTYINCQPCISEYFDNWQQATLYLIASIQFPDFS